MKGNLDGGKVDLVSCNDMTREQFEELFESADSFRKAENNSEPLKGKTVSLAFFEPSTRTYTSFEVAAKRLGAMVIGFRGSSDTSVAKGENLADTVRMLSTYSDCIVMRHKYEGAAKFATEITGKTVVNAGDGKQEHPTQAVLDLYTVRRSLGKIDGLTFCFIGDLRYSRTVNSLLFALKRFKPKAVYLIAPKQLSTRSEVLSSLGYECKQLENISSIEKDIDVLYVTRLQKERFVDEEEYQKAKGSYVIDRKLVESLKESAIILHPLPRVDEVDRSIDSDKRVKYFEQAENGIYARMAILNKLMG